MAIAYSSHSVNIYKNLLLFIELRLLKIKNTLHNTLKYMLSKEKPIIAFWWAGVISNWGDALNPVLIKKISGKEVMLSSEIITFRNVEVYCVIGSILDLASQKNLVVWGSGFLSSSSKIRKKPRKVLAVRGPLTRDVMLKQGVNCPEIYGDPALLYPLFYRPNVKKRYKLGVIPHYIDQNNNLIDIFKGKKDVLVINILDEFNKFIDDICKCELIVSSSLHGIIAADAYRVPSIWIEFSSNVKGNGFKFYDYFASVGRENESPLKITEKTTFQEIYSQYKHYDINIRLDKLLEVCPFLDPIEAEKLKIKLNELYK